MARLLPRAAPVRQERDALGANALPRHKPASMRHWLFHPIIFYALLAAFAAGVFVLSLRPDLGPVPAPHAVGQVENGAVLLQRDALAHPELAPGQVAHITRDGLGRPLALRFAVLPNQPEPSPTDPGLRILLKPDVAARIANRPTQLEISIRPVEISTAAVLAISLQGSGPVVWQSKELTPGAQTVRFTLPATGSPTAVGLRAISRNNDYNYGFEIVRIRILPSGAA